MPHAGWWDSSDERGPHSLGNSSEGDGSSAESSGESNSSSNVRVRSVARFQDGGTERLTCVALSLLGIFDCYGKKAQKI
jgi:hypothetical protein